MTIVKHPTLDVTFDVPDSRVASWVASGWLADEPIKGDLVIETDGGQLAPTKDEPKPKTKKK